MGIGWAIVGASTIGREYMVDAIRQTGGEPLWIVSGDAARAKAFAQACDIAQHTVELCDALADERVKLIYVGSINFHHRAQVIVSAEAGKHVLCDKPLATRYRDGLEMVKACERAGVVLAVNHHLRASTVHQEMRRLIETGAIGDVRSVLILHAGWLRPELQTWRLSDPLEGAIYLDLSVHDVDLARFLLGQEPLTAIGVGAAIRLGGPGVHDHAMYTLVMSGGTMVQVHESFVTPGAGSLVQVLGSEGALVASDSLRQTAGGTLEIKDRTGATKLVPVPEQNPYVMTIQRMLATIEKQDRPLANGFDGLVSLGAAEAIDSAATKGRSINVESKIKV
jgi:1,5-anhydro-D-fructose reductase (1,5-anhydro-D-mannitol-forming)